MEPNKDPAKREKEMPTDTPLNPEMMFGVDENGSNSPFPNAVNSVDEQKSNRYTNHNSTEEITNHSDDNS